MIGPVERIVELERQRVRVFRVPNPGLSVEISRIIINLVSSRDPSLGPPLHGAWTTGRDRVSTPVTTKTLKQKDQLVLVVCYHNPVLTRVKYDDIEVTGPTSRDRTSAEYRRN